MTQPNQKKHIGISLKLLRIKYNLSQEEMALRANVAQSTVYDIENGVRTNPGFLTIIRLISIFPITPYEILDVLGYKLQIEDLNKKILENRYL